MEMKTKNSPFRNGAAWPVTLAKFILILLLIVLLNIGVSWLIDKLEIQFWPQHMKIVERVVVAGAILYICLMATPFLPGIEIGLALMIILGPAGVVLIYLCTLIALTLSFWLGRLFPARLLASMLHWLHFRQAAAFVTSFDAIQPEKRLQFLLEKSSSQALPALLKRRYLVLGLLLNLPGNVLIGGGGGIAMMAGMCRLYTFPKFLALIAVAILPVPILILISDAFQ